MEWYAAESTAEEKPKELDITSSPHLVYKRRNIEREPMRKARQAKSGYMKNVRRIKKSMRASRQNY